MNKEKFETPEIEIIVLPNDDIVTTSGDEIFAPNKFDWEIDV